MSSRHRKKKANQTEQATEAAVQAAEPVAEHTAPEEPSVVAEPTEQPASAPEENTAQNHRKSEPVRTVTPSDIKKPQVSFMNSIAHVEADSVPQHGAAVNATEQAYDHAVMHTDGEQDEDYRPKIRRMSDSTRAKELRKRRFTGEKMPYMKDTPVSVPVTLPGAKLRKRKDESEVLERIPENLKAHPLDEPQPVSYIQQAEHTQINLSQDNRAENPDINIDVRFQDERRARTDLPKEVKEYSKSEDKASILNDLLELKTNLSIRVAILGLLAAMSILMTLLDWFPKPIMPAAFSSTESPVAFLTVQLLLGLAAIPFCSSLLKNGYLKLLQFRADCDSLAAMAMMSAELAAFLALPSYGMLRRGVISVYIPVGLMALFLNAVGKKLIVSRALRNYERLSDGNPKYGIHYVEDEKRAENLSRGTTGDFPILAAMNPVENPEDFLKYTFSTDIADKFCRIAVPVIFFIALVFSIGISIVRASEVPSAICYGTSVFALCFSACACTAITLISNLPMASGTKDYVRNSGLLLGYQSVDDFYDVNTIMIDAQMLFPRGTTKLDSIQVLGESQIEEALQYAASLTKHGGSILKDLFAGAILAEEKLLLPVENYAYDEGKGVSGWIQNKRVLLGTRDMMIEHSIEGLPSQTRVQALTMNGGEAVYLSVAGTVSALFLVRLETSKSIKHWMRELMCENLFLLVRSNDPLLSQRRIAKMFSFPEHMLKVIPARLEADYAAETAPVQDGKPSMLCAGRLAGFAQTIIGAKRIRAAANLGMILQAATALLGLLFVLLFISLGAYKDVSGGILVIYHIICTVVTVLSVRMKDT